MFLVNQFYKHQNNLKSLCVHNEQGKKKLQNYVSTDKNRNLVQTTNMIKHLPLLTLILVTAVSLSVKCYPLSFLSVSYVKIAKLLNHIIIPTFIHDPVQQNLPMQAQIT